MLVASAAVVTADVPTITADAAEATSIRNQGIGMTVLRGGEAGAWTGQSDRTPTNPSSTRPRPAQRRSRSKRNGTSASGRRPVTTNSASR
jgi:hypothetical protein